MNFFKLFIFAVFLLFSASSFSQLNVVKKAQAVTSKPTETEIIGGIKEALEKAASESAGRLSLKDGFLANNAVKILFPPEALKVERTLRGMGLNSLCDDVILSLNRAAESAAGEAKPVFISAVKQMSFTDVTAILNAKEKDAATSYFKNATGSELKEKFKPVIDSCFKKNGAEKYWREAFTAYNKLPMVKKINPNLEDYALQKAMDGMFIEIAKEELKIRNDARFRTSPLLKKVFSYADLK